MIALALLVVGAYLALAAVELPALWGKREQRGDLWAVLALLLLGLIYAVVATLGWRHLSPWKVAEAIFRPVGELLFRPKGG